MLSSQVKSSQVNLLRFFFGILIALVLLSDTAFADLMYFESAYGGTLTLRDSQGIPHSTDIQASYVYPFTHNGSPRILITDYTGSDSVNLAVYDPNNLSQPIANGFLDGHINDITVAELGSNIVLSSYGDDSIVEINPETCEIVSTYTEPGYSFVYLCAYGGQIVAYLTQNNSYNSKFITMDRLGNLTGTFNIEEDVFWIPAGELAVSGGELYFTLGDNMYPYASDAADVQGIYRVSNMLGNMNVRNAVRITADNPEHICRDGKGGLYYTVYGANHLGGAHSNRYIYHWDGTSSSQVFDLLSYRADISNIGIRKIDYDIKNGILYAFLENELVALTPDSSGQLTASQPITEALRWAVVGNPADSSSGSTITPTPSPTPQNTPLPSAVIEPAPDLTSDVLERVAESVSVDVSEIRTLTAENISAPQEPTQAMRDYARSENTEFTGKLSTITVDEDGWYVFKVTLSDELWEKVRGQNVSGFKFEGMSDLDSSAAIASLLSGIVSTWEVLTMSGEKMDTFGVREFLMVGLLEAGRPLSVYLLKIIIAILAGGCSSGTSILLLAAIPLLLRKH